MALLPVEGSSFVSELEGTPKVRLRVWRRKKRVETVCTWWWVMVDHVSGVGQESKVSQYCVMFACFASYWWREDGSGK